LKGLKVFLTLKKPILFIYFLKSSNLVKKIKSAFNGLKSLKMAKKIFLAKA
jgi:hypothetical protein